ncbi:hypothetical protein CEXT_28491 [Caerostris extrusa]|uniref:Uncharacterized protein n=1 Tax=Caerostris extrusa TaxID=172846 RepID=A0AAV4SW62_CAEEX|nr:hypothetical protein CEXT_28491 [Caerostris extrusa]
MGVSIFEVHGYSQSFIRIPYPHPAILMGVNAHFIVCITHFALTFPAIQRGGHSSSNYFNPSSPPMVIYLTKICLFKHNPYKNEKGRDPLNTSLLTIETDPGWQTGGGTVNCQVKKNPCLLPEGRENSLSKIPLANAAAAVFLFRPQGQQPKASCLAKQQAVSSATNAILSRRLKRGHLFFGKGCLLFHYSVFIASHKSDS